MKRVLILCTFLTFSAIHLPVQTCHGQNIGLQLGGGWFTMTGANSDATEVGTVFRPALGVFGQFYLFNFFLLQPGICYLLKGIHKTHSLNSGLNKIGGTNYSQYLAEEMTETATLGYIQIPLLLRYEIPLQGKLQPAILLGPAFAFNVSGKDEASGFGEWDGNHDIGNLKKVDFSGIAGLGLAFPVGKLKMGIDLRYDRSFSSAFEDVTAEALANDVDEELWTETDPVTFERSTKAVDFKNSGFSFQVGVMLPIGGGQ